MRANTGQDRTANARAAKAVKHRAWATFQDPSKDSDAGIVLAAIHATPGLPLWALARNTRMTMDRVKYACMYLKRRKKVFNHKSEYLDQKIGADRVQPCWFPGQARNALSIVDGTRCQVAVGYGRVCGVRLVDQMNTFGRITWVCPACDRRNRGLCRACPRPLPPHGVDGPRPWYCEPCADARRKARNNHRVLTPEYKAKKAQWERERVARCKAAGLPHRSDRKAA